MDHFGERPVSFRGLLRRYVTTQESTATVAATDFGLNLSHPMFPINYLPIAAASIGNPNLFGYLQYAYVGYKGSIKHRIAHYSPQQVSQHKSAMLHLSAETNAAASSFTSVVNLPIVQQVQRSDLSGSVRLDLSSNGGLEVEIPFYNPNLFAISFGASDCMGSEGFCLTNWSRAFSVFIPMIPGPTGTAAIVVDSAAGEDFSFLRFQGAPYYSSG